MPDEEWFRGIHKRLLEGDPVAPSTLAEAMWAPLLERLRTRNPRLASTDFLEDSAADALISYFKRPDQFDPTKRGLLGFLVMAAEGDLRNALAKAKRQRREEIPLESVELELAARNRADEGIVASEAAATTHRRLAALFEDAADRAAVRLMADGERSTAAFTQVWSLQSLSPMAQKGEVKRRKDRIKKVLARHGKDAQ
jgi:hypothetical protein